MKNIILKSKKRYSIQDFSLDTIVRNDDLLSELEMATLPETMQRILGNPASHLYLPILLKKIEQYDKSHHVNAFIYEGNEYWLDKATRVGLMHLVNCSDDYIELVVENNVIQLSVEKARHFLIELEKYASKCYLQTQKHLQIAKNLNNSEDILNYDYTSGYPEKIILE